jgi:hypothetical protein
MQSLQAKTYGMAALGALVMLGAELQVGVQLWFAPGWANGWPGGLSIHRVWSTGMTVIFFVIQMTIGIGLGALIGLFLCRSSPGRRFAGWVFGVWLFTCIALTVLTCAWAYREIYASTLAMWPNGYNAEP